MKGFVALCMVGLLLMIGAVAVAGCESPAAQQERARAARIQAEAQAYEQRLQAETQAAAERAAVREAARQAGHERALEMLPYLITVVGALLLAGFGAFAVWDLRRVRGQAPAAEVALLLELERRRLADNQLMWHALADVQRRQGLPAKGGKEVIVYGPGGPAGES